MYDLPGLRPAIDRLWEAIRDRMRITGDSIMPDRLDFARPLDDIWRDPALVLAQTCGLPFMTSLRNHVKLVATPCYDLPGCDGPAYRSFIMVAAGSQARSLDDLRGRTAAINDWNSQSGANALRAAVASMTAEGPFFGSVIVTGSHCASLNAVAVGCADVAAVDCVTHGLLAAHAPDHLAGTRVLDQTRPTPGLPLITASSTKDATITRLIAALHATLADADLAETRANLHLCGFAPLTVNDYAVSIVPDQAAWSSSG